MPVKGSVKAREASPEAVADRAGIIDEMPFDPTAQDVSRAVAVAANATPIVYNADSGNMPLQVDQDALLGQPFAVTNVRLIPIVGNYETGEIAHYLCTVTGQAVKLDGSKIVRKGRTFFYIAGRVVDVTNPDGVGNSVHGSEMMRLVNVASPSQPVIMPDGIRKVATAAGGSYYTIRPDASKVDRVDWFE